MRTTTMSSALLRVVVLIVVASFPVVFVGAMATEMGRDLEFGTSELGVAVTFYYIAAAGLSSFAGRYVERIGVGLGARLCLALGGLACFVIGASQNLVMVCAGLLAGGAAIALAQPVAAVLVVGRIPFARRGLAFGIKQASIPAATSIAGAAIPLVALTVGWRWAFVAAGSLAWAAALRAGVGSGGRTEVRGERTRLGAGPLPLLVAATALAAAAALTLPVFLVSAAVNRGYGVGTAGVMLAVASIIGLIGRLAIGLVADRRGRAELGLVALLMGLGAIGLLGMSTPSHLVFGVSVIVAFGAGRSWQGLFSHAVTSRWNTTPAAVTGLTQSGSYVGGIFGPLGFGLVSTHAGESVGWVLLGCCMGLAAGLVVIVMKRDAHVSAGAAIAEP